MVLYFAPNFSKNQLFANNPEDYLEWRLNLTPKMVVRVHYHSGRTNKSQVVTVIVVFARLFPKTGSAESYNLWRLGHYGIDRASLSTDFPVI